MPLFLVCLITWLVNACKSQFLSFFLIVLKRWLSLQVQPKLVLMDLKLKTCFCIYLVSFQFCFEFVLCPFDLHSLRIHLLNQLFWFPSSCSKFFSLQMKFKELYYMFERKLVGRVYKFHADASCLTASNISCNWFKWNRSIYKVLNSIQTDKRSCKVATVQRTLEYITSKGLASVRTCKTHTWRKTEEMKHFKK